MNDPLGTLGRKRVARGRARIFGTERPLETPLAATPYVTPEFGLFTGTTVRWYVKGKTEFHAVKRLLPGHHAGGIELINLRGNLAQESDNIALKLADQLREDRALRRFSLVSLDRDVPANVKSIRRRIQQEELVGIVFDREPDFEFHNFSLDELVEIAARFNESHGYSGDPIRDGDWSGIEGASSFQER